MYKYLFDAESCWYKKVCGKYGTDSCNKSCIRYMEMHYLMETSNIPKGKQFKNVLIPPTEDIENFKFLNEIKKDIFSKRFGNGKTTWAIKLMQAYFNEVWCFNGFRERGLFIHTPTFITKCKESISVKDEDFENLKSLLINVDLVIWDDIATGRLSEFDNTNLLVYIDQRKLNGKSNIYTGNLSKEELERCLGNRLTSRVWNDSSVVELVGCDRRIEVEKE